MWSKGDLVVFREPLCVPPFVDVADGEWGSIESVCDNGDLWIRMLERHEELAPWHNVAFVPSRFEPEKLPSIVVVVRTPASSSVVVDPSSAMDVDVESATVELEVDPSSGESVSTTSTVVSLGGLTRSAAIAPVTAAAARAVPMITLPAVVPAAVKSGANIRELLRIDSAAAGRNGAETNSVNSRFGGVGEVRSGSDRMRATSAASSLPSCSPSSTASSSEDLRGETDSFMASPSSFGFAPWVRVTAKTSQDRTRAAIRVGAAPGAGVA